MNRLFGSKAKGPKPTIESAQASIETRMESLDVRIAKLNGELQVYQQKMSRMRDGPGKNAMKQKALKVLKQRKQLEQQKDSLYQQSWNMEQTQGTTEGLRNALISVDVMKEANKELKKQYGKLNIDKIEALQDEMADLMEASEELQATMGRGYDLPDDVSESELDAELEALGEEMQFDIEEPSGAIPSYLQDAGELPEFVDEPIEQKQQEAAQ
ncbi:hypothetical protein CANCADRAFT_1888 [Tortispora caseinolytica NRRL Y-17796]|uniref:Charged multivesicular body protein 5 n=1 Tax=Tortispora caseinolytica NRRL Y-17796 TaxID=767744 RepID=A0A1E4TEH9_9ASCO|nr:hypothetical protein CANCADRAFT_1888 [Tortispora caseinolytica NRRL Y-17796]